MHDQAQIFDKILSFCARERTKSSGWPLSASCGRTLLHLEQLQTLEKVPKAMRLWNSHCWGSRNKGGVALGEVCRKGRSPKVYPRGRQRRTERFSCRGNSEKRTSTRGPALEGGRLTRSRGSICATGTWSWWNRAKKYPATKFSATYRWSKYSYN